jgi:excisionase family DNA binding protein
MGGERMNEKLLRVSEAAEWLDLSEYQVLAYARAGIIPHVRLGRQVRFDPAALEEFINNGGKSYPGGWKREA